LTNILANPIPANAVINSRKEPTRTRSTLRCMRALNINNGIGFIIEKVVRGSFRNGGNGYDIVYNLLLRISIAESASPSDFKQD